MAYKYENIFDLMRSTADSVVNSQDNWKTFLDTAAMNYKRPFHNQLLIFNQRPDATACATFDYWNQNMGRFVKKGSKGIATIDVSSRKTEILFDISDTGSNNNKEVPIWTVTDEMYSLLGSVLQEHFETAVSSGDLVAVLFEVGAKATDEVLPLFVEDIRGRKENSGLDELDDVNLETALRGTLSSSLIYELLKRCNLNPEEYSDSFDFSYIDCFNSYDTIASLGSFLNDKANELFKDIALTVRSIEKTFALSENINKEVEKNESDLQATRGLSNPEHIHSETGNELRKVRDAEKDLSNERKEERIHIADDERDTEPTLSGDGQRSDGSGEQISRADGTPGGRDGETESDRSDEVGGVDEQLPTGSAGDSAVQENLRLSSDDGAVAQPEQANLGLEYVLTSVLQHHRWLKVDGAEIQNYFVENADEEQRIGFIQDCYNKDYTELITEEGHRLGYHANDEGLEVWTGAYLGSPSRVTVPWPLVVSAIGVLVNNDEYLSLSEKVEIPTEEQQSLFVSESILAQDVQAENNLLLPQQVIDEVICSGSNEIDSVHSICAHYKRNRSIDENVRFLADEYGTGTGKGFIIADEHYSAVFEEDGIRIAEGRSVADAKETVLLSWKSVDKRIKELLSEGRYMSAVDYDEVEEKLVSKTSSVVDDVCGIVRRLELTEAFNLKAFDDVLALDVLSKRFDERTVTLKEFLSEPEHVKALLEETNLLIEACKGAEPLLRVRWYEFNELGEASYLLDTLSRDVQEYPAERPFEPSYKVFITDDEVNFDLMSGSHTQDGKYRIYRYFNEGHSATEKANFLKDEYGIGGGNGALGGVFRSDHNHDSKGLVLSKGDIFKPYDTVKLSWSAVARKIDKLIEEGRYLTDDEIENLPNYEKNLIAKSIYNFYIDFPYSFVENESRYGSVDKIAELLTVPGKVNEIYENMLSEFASLDKDARGYAFKEGCLKDVERLASGISLFDFEARKAEFEARDGVVEVNTELKDDTNAVENIDNGEGRSIAEYELSVGDTVLIGNDRFEIMSIEDNMVVINDVEFPLDVQSFTTEEFLEKVNDNSASIHYTLQRSVDDSPELLQNSNVSRETIHNEPDGAGKPVAEGTEEAPSFDAVYRYYLNSELSKGNYPSPVGNEPLNVTLFDKRTHLDDLNIDAWGYLEYGKPLIFGNINAYDLFVVSNETMTKYRPVMRFYDEGTEVENLLEREEYSNKTIARITEAGDVILNESNMPIEVLDQIQLVADQARAGYEEKLRVAAEELAKVEKRYAPKPEINRRTMVCKNYNALKKFAEDVLTGKYTYMRFSSGEDSGYEPLYVERIGENTIAMAHTFVQNGDLMYDPEMTFTFDNEKEELQALTYEHSAMGTYQVVRQGESVNLGLQRELNSFLNMWLKNINNQKQPLVRAIDRDGNEIDFTIDKGELGVEVEAVSNEAVVIDEISAQVMDSSSVVDEAIDSTQVGGDFDFDEYLNIKDLYPDDVVAYQIGDFYEFLGEDAEKVAKELGLKLTSRDVGLSEKLPLCAIPAFALEKDLDILIQNGLNVAVHGFNEKAGKVITVDYETEYSAAKDSKLNVIEAVADEEKIAFEPESERIDTTSSKPLKREKGIDYKISDLEQDAGSAKERFRRNVEAISLLKQLEADERLATPDEQKVLAGYVGWGGLADAFDDSKSAWASEFKELKDLLTPEEYSSAKSSTLSAFYTSPVIIKFMYDALDEMGFKKGNILEPSCGIGNFIGVLPESLKDSKVYGVELDSVSGRIAQQLYQNQDIRIQGFEKTDFPDSFFDVAIGNVPFGDFKVNDKKYNKNKFLIHDYFFAKTLDKVRPGGVVAFITSKGTLDKTNSAVREYIAQRAEFLGAVRLPDNAFKGTDVTSDIIFLQKRDRPIEIDRGDSNDWVELSYLYDQETGEILEDPNGELATINSYFDMHPEHILGDMVVESTQYGYDTTCKAREGESLSDLLKNIHFKADERLKEYFVDEQESTLESVPADPSVKNFSYALVDGKVYFRENSRMYPQTFANEETENRVKGLVNLREWVRSLIEMQMEDYSDSAIAKVRQELNTAYDNFSKKYGLINDRKNKKAFESDSSYFLLASLENLDDDGKLKSKADIFYKRTIRPHVAVTHVDTSAEALEVSISEKARVDIPYMMELSGKSAEEIEKDLSGVIFRVPNKLHGDGSPYFVPADEYLSGNVREKLRVAKEFAERDAVFASNVAALEMVQPKDLDASEISVRLGATWIEPKYVEQFMYELLETPEWMRNAHYSNRMSVNFAKVTGEWFIENKNYDSYNVKVNTTYGTKRISAYKIIEDTLNLRDSRVYDYVEDENGRKKAVLNREETTIAQQKQELIKEAFVEWIWKDPKRRETLTAFYNDNFNNIRPREYDGSHLTFGGINPEIELRNHQLNAIARIIYGGNTLLAHAVGAGKTFEMVAAAQESKRLGLCNKSMFVVPNHLIEQFASDYMKLYPSANVLCSTKKDFEPGNRKKFCSRIATGEWDAVIIGHSQFEKIPMSVEGQKKALQEQLDDVMDGILELKEEQGERFSVKQLEKTKKNLEAKLESLNDDSRKDDVVTFEELGIDRLFVDEAHYYKNLFLYTKMRNVAGISSREAQKSSDLFMKCRYLDKLTGGKGIIFATGTPVSNSMTELYTMQRYLQYDMLCKRGLQHFDSWASTFGETVTAIELAPEGTGYRAKTRFARFYNLPELIASFKEIADVQTADMLHLPVPKANFHTVSLQPSGIQREVVQGLAERATRIHNKMVKPNEDNMLLVTNDGRKLALDQRLINPMFEDDEESKVNTCADNVFEIWEKTADFKGTQLVFCDLSTPKPGAEFDVYNDLKDKLVKKGIPAKEIAFVHNAKTDKQKASLFEKMRRGQVRVLLGSTSKLGVGTNVQDRLIALHDIDCPWRPSDLEQRLGRIVRQGNNNDEVDIYRYVTKDTFDAYSWQLIENKQSFISQIFTSKSPARAAEDIDESVLSYAEIKSLATGDPRIKEKMDLDVSVKRLKLLKQSYLREKYSLEDAVLKKYPKDISMYTDKIEKCKKDIALLSQYTSDDKEYFFPMTVDGKVYADKGEAGEALIAFCKAQKNIGNDERPCGEYRGFKMSVSYDHWEHSFVLTLQNGLRYSANLGSNNYGNIVRINNVLASLPDKLADYENKLANTKVQLENAKVQLNKPFKHEHELKEKSARLDQLNIELSLDKDNAIDIAVSLDEKSEYSSKESGNKTREVSR